MSNGPYGWGNGPKPRNAKPHKASHSGGSGKASGIVVLAAAGIFGGPLAVALAAIGYVVYQHITG